MLVSLLKLWDDAFTRVLVLATSIIYLFGLLDDVRGITAFPKLIGQILASVILIVSNVSVHFIESLALPFLSIEVVKWLDFTENIQLPDASGNQLGILGTEIEDQDVVLHGQK